jgi:hypothetical protein
MPGHGERFIETFDDWFVRINKRVQRLERRVSINTVAEALPAGAVTLWAGPVVPAGWLPLDGGTYPAADYPRLAAALGATTATVFVPDAVAPDGLMYIIKT